MLHIACVEWRDYEGRGREYVALLADMIRRNLNMEYRFVCLTDDPARHPGIDTITLPGGLTGWWNKLALFKPGMFPKGDRVLFFDLDTLIIGPIDDLAAYEGSFAILRDVFRPDGLQSSVMAWEAGTADHIWTLFETIGDPEKYPGGDQEWIESVMQAPGILQGKFPGAFVSFKRDCSTNGPPQDARVVVFHGHPRPHESEAEWVNDVWKEGGRQIAAVKVDCNTPTEELHRNIRANSRRDVEWLQAMPENEAHAVIVGGAPSLADTLEEIRWRKSQGQMIFALNAAARYLFKAGIKPDFHVMMDARPENVVLANPAWSDVQVYASQCHPSLFERLGKKGNPLLFHQVLDGIEENFPKGREYTLVCGEVTVGLTALMLAYTMGFRKLHLYGYDSSFKDSQHAYEQSRTQAELDVREVSCDGRSFLTNPAMLVQAQKFPAKAKMLADLGCEITVHGYGLLPTMARAMMRPVPDGPVREVGGFLWPEKDRECADAVLSSVGEVDRVVALCQGKGLAIQAGGNVGVYAMKLAESFRRVMTFEPDEDNYGCLRRNVWRPNIACYRAALGETAGTVRVDRIDEQNVGAHQVVPGEGDIPLATIDSLQVTECDLIWLDIEGFELPALKGAIQTIERYSPVVVIEDKGLSERYGVLKGEAVTWLEQRGYEVADRFGRDIALVHRASRAQAA